MLSIKLNDFDPLIPDDIIFYGMSVFGLEMSINSWLSKYSPDKKDEIFEKLKTKFIELKSEEPVNADELQQAFVAEQLAKADRMTLEVGPDPEKNEIISEKLRRRAL